MRVDNNWRFTIQSYDRCFELKVWSTVHVWSFLKSATRELCRNVLFLLLWCSETIIWNFTRVPRVHLCENSKSKFTLLKRRPKTYDIIVYVLVESDNWVHNQFLRMYFFFFCIEGFKKFYCKQSAKNKLTHLFTVSICTYISGPVKVTCKDTSRVNIFIKVIFIMWVTHSLYPLKQAVWFFFLFVYFFLFYHAYACRTTQHRL